MFPAGFEYGGFHVSTEGHCPSRAVVKRVGMRIGDESILCPNFIFREKTYAFYDVARLFGVLH